MVAEGQNNQEITTWIASLEPKQGVALGSAFDFLLQTCCMTGQSAKSV